MSLLLLLASGAAPPQYIDPELIGAPETYAPDVSGYCDAQLVGNSSAPGPTVDGYTDAALAGGSQSFAPDVVDGAAEEILAEIVGSAATMTASVLDGYLVGGSTVAERLRAAVGGVGSTAQTAISDYAVCTVAFSLRPGRTEAEREAYLAALEGITPEPHKDLYVRATLLGGASGVLCGVAYYASGHGPIGSGWTLVG